MMCGSSPPRVQIPPLPLLTWSDTGSTKAPTGSGGGLRACAAQTLRGGTDRAAGRSRPPAAGARSAVLEILVEVALQQSGELIEGPLGTLALGAQRDLVAVTDVLGQQQQDAGGLHRRRTLRLDRDGDGLLARRLGEDRGRAGMEAAGAGDLHGSCWHRERLSRR